ncbi:BamA/TamA family outer membrane protein [Anseongella ginsenosidimutans]|nr:BamA/TamA family outer membrane protein [Anseongella ginsenosidimutans]
MHRFFFGQNYRRLWATPVKMRVFRLEEEMGGLEIVKKGGGQQTLSLRLADSSGKEWNLRTVQKNPEKALPPRLRATVAEKIVQDQISAAHPFGALAVPTVAGALDIPHARPELVYLPDDPALGMYQEDFANAVYTFEEREPIPDDTKSTTSVLEKLQEDNDHVIDEKAVLKARLLDLLIGDWDRHEDQWRWGKVDKEHGNIYYPIPRDRDQVFFTNSGLFPGIAARKWAMPKFQGFKPSIRDVNGFMFNARYFDRLFLHELEEETWQETASLVQETLTDRLLDSALHQMPDTIYRLSGRKILHTLKARRDHLKQDALDYYHFLARAVDIPGSDQPDLFQVSLEKDGRVKVRGSKVEKRERVFYERSFYPAVTKEVRIYGRDDEDVFEVSGAGHSPIKIRMIGGSGTDIFRVGEEVKGKGRLFIYDRSDLENTFPPRGKAVLRTSEEAAVNEYDPQSFQYDRLMPLLTAGYNLDDGVFLGAGFQYIHHAFRKEPYASRNKLMVGHALATSAWFLDYEGEFMQLLGNMDLLADLEAKAPHNTTNFFGAGNETVFREELSDPAIQYYRTRYNLVEGEVKIRLPLGNSLRVFGGPAGQYFNMRSEENDERFIRDYAGLHPQDELFTHRTFAGLVAGFEIDTRNHELTPTRGFSWNTTFKGMQQVQGEKDRYGQLQTELRLFTSFNLNPRLVIANRIGAGYTFGEPGFYQLLYLGGKQNLRGYRNFRFAGESMFYHNIELRLKLFDFTSYLFPGSVGLTGFHDIGRVWRPGEDSDKWHQGYGGGIYLVPAEMLVLSGSVGFSEEEILPSVSLGFQF